MSISQNILQRIHNNKEKQPIIFCFTITLHNNDILYLCSANKVIHINDFTFMPNSGLTLYSANFNDSAQDEIILHGIFEQGGITTEVNLVDSKITIYCIIDNELIHFATNYISNFIKHDLEFYITSVPEAVKYNRSILNVYSKKCRAKFGDAKCQVKLDEYKKQYTIQEIGVDYISVGGMDHESGYYTFGDMLIMTSNNVRVQYKILSHINDRIQIDGILDKNLMTLNQIHDITLIPGCDKKFSTCCDKYHNAINFRGEPSIPGDNFLKY